MANQKSTGVAVKSFEVKAVKSFEVKAVKSIEVKAIKSFGVKANNLSWDDVKLNQKF